MTIRDLVDAQSSEDKDNPWSRQREPPYASEAARCARTEVVGLVKSVRLRCLRIFVDQTGEDRAPLHTCGLRRLGRDADDLDADGGEHRVEGGTELAVPVAQ